MYLFRTLKIILLAWQKQQENTVRIHCLMGLWLRLFFVCVCPYAYGLAFTLSYAHANVTNAYALMKTSILQIDMKRWRCIHTKLIEGTSKERKLFIPGVTFWSLFLSDMFRFPIVFCLLLIRINYTL